MKKTIAFFLACLIILMAFSFVCLADDYVYIEDAAFDSAEDAEGEVSEYEYSDFDYLALDAVLSEQTEQFSLIIDSALDSAVAALIAADRRGIMDTPLSDFTVTEGLLAILVGFLTCLGVFSFANGRRFF